MYGCSIHWHAVCCGADNAASLIRGHADCMHLCQGNCVRDFPSNAAEGSYVVRLAQWDAKRDDTGALGAFCLRKRRPGRLCLGAASGWATGYLQIR